MFFSYLCVCITRALTPEFYSDGLTGVDASATRCLTVSDELLLCLRLYFASNLADFPFLLRDMLAGLRPAKETKIMTLHHLLSAVCFWGGQ